MAISRNKRRKLARLKAIDAHNTQLVLARKAERQEIVTRNMSTPKERTYGLRAASVYQRGMYKS